MYRHLFSRFLSADPQRLHFAAHSHHLWPDVTLYAHTRAWHDAAKHVDEKWGPVFDEHLPTAQAHVARILNTDEPASVAWAPNTHEFVIRLFSCIETKPVRVLTTDSEFYSFDRQLSRWEEAGSVVATRVPSEPFDTFVPRFTSAASTTEVDVVFLSHVFFNSGAVVTDLESIVGAVRNEQTLVVVDGYHAFMAIPVDIAPIAGRAFYMSGGYKYAMSGEGVCPMHCPEAYCPRPVSTGWFASFGTLTEEQAGRVAYAEGGGRFLGATYDPTGIYRFNAVMDLLDREGISIRKLHAYVGKLQDRFVSGLRKAARAVLDPETIIPPLGMERGNFLTFRTPAAGAMRSLLRSRNVVCDHRDDRLRLGFGLYHSADDVDELLRRVANP